MKKMIALLAVLILAISCTALAETSDPILFRGIEWGISHADLSKQIELTSLGTINDTISVENLVYDGEDMPFDDVPIYNAHFASSEVSAIGKVAGYNLNDVYLLFAPVPDEDGNLTADPEHTALYYAIYILDVVDHDSNAADLKAKLASLYGDVDMTTTNATVWFGGEGTMVSYFDRNDNNNYLYIKYGFQGGDDLLQAAHDALNAASALDTEGL